jgi:filamentous hemagglutinin family protein
MKLLTVIPLFLSFLTVPNLASAQVVSDNTVSTTVNQVENHQFEITGGEQAGRNLFHSFEQFSVSAEGAIHFLNEHTIENIISRVTGELPSDIQGLVTARGSANLILLNPNGITFGENATIQIGGSFMATTAEHIRFADGTTYSATETSQEPLLTITAPVGLGFGNNPGNITNRAGRVDPSRNDAAISGLEVPVQETLALIGGDILIEEGILTASGGRIELGAIAGDSEVGIIPTSTGWEIDYSQVKAFADIQVSNNSLISVSDVRDDSTLATSGSAQIQGRQIIFDVNSDLGATNRDRLSSGVMFLRATDSLILSNNSSIFNISLRASSSGGDIFIETPTLEISDSSRLNATTVFSDGAGGKITVNASNWVKLDELSVISTETFGGPQGFPDGEGGDININTRNLEINNGSRIVSSVREGSSSNGGTLNINATESITIADSRRNLFTGETQFSRIASEARTPPLSSGEVFLTTGNAGRINVSTPDLNLIDGGQISVAVRNQAQGKAGELSVNADQITITGKDSGIFASSVSPQPAGNLTVNADSLQVQAGGAISATATGTGDAGNLRIQADFLQLQQGKITANTEAGKGNIFLSTQDLRLRDRSIVQTNASGFADGGNITIDASTLTVLENGQINANAQQGFGGRVVINTGGLFLSPDSAITATSERGEAFNGVVEVNNTNQQLNSVSPSLDATPEPQLYEQCSAQDAGSRFVVSGSETSVAMSVEIPEEITVEEDLALPTQIVEARGWVRNEQGETVLTANSPFAFQSACLQETATDDTKQ